MPHDIPDLPGASYLVFPGPSDLDPSFNALAEQLLEQMVDARVHTAIQMTADNHSFDR